MIYRPNKAGRAESHTCKSCSLDFRVFRVCSVSSLLLPVEPVPPVLLSLLPLSPPRQPAASPPPHCGSADGSSVTSSFLPPCFDPAVLIVQANPTLPESLAERPALLLSTQRLFIPATVTAAAVSFSLFSHFSSVSPFWSPWPGQFLPLQLMPRSSSGEWPRLSLAVNY